MNLLGILPALTLSLVMTQPELICLQKPREWASPQRVNTPKLWGWVNNKHNSLHLLTPNWTDFTLSYSPATTCKEESLSSLSCFSPCSQRQRITTESFGPHLLPPPPHPVIHSVTCLFFGKITLATVSSIHSHGCQSPSHAFCLRLSLSFDPPQSSALFSLTIPCPFPAYYLITALRIIFCSKNAWPAGSENVLYFSISGPLLTLTCTHLPILNQSVVPCPVLTVASLPAYGFLKTHLRWSGIPISLWIFHSLLWSTQSKVLA